MNLQKNKGFLLLKGGKVYDPFIKLNGNPILLTIARLEKRKGHIEILKTIQKLKIKFPKIKYIISGEGSEKSSLEKMVKDLEWKLKLKRIILYDVLMLGKPSPFSPYSQFYLCHFL